VIIESIQYLGKNKVGKIFNIREKNNEKILAKRRGRQKHRIERIERRIENRLLKFNKL